MSEMVLGTEETQDPLLTSLVTFTANIGAEFTDICSYGLTYGDAYVPFNPDEDEECTEEDVSCSQAWVRVMSVTPKATTEGWGGDCAMVLTAQLEVGVIRCVTIPERGEAPGTTDVLEAGLQAISDMQAMLRGAMKQDLWDAIDAQTWVPIGPSGGQYGGTWDFSVEFSTPIACDED